MSTQYRMRMFAVVSILCLLSCPLLGDTIVKMTLEQIARNSYVIVVGDVVSMQPSARWSRLGLMQCTFKVVQFIDGKEAKVGDAITVDAVRSAAKEIHKSDVTSAWPQGIGPYCSYSSL